MQKYDFYLNLAKKATDYLEDRKKMATLAQNLTSYAL